MREREAKRHLCTHHLALRLLFFCPDSYIKLVLSPLPLLLLLLFPLLPLLLDVVGDHPSHHDVRHELGVLHELHRHGAHDDCAHSVALAFLMGLLWCVVVCGWVGGWGGWVWVAWRMEGERRGGRGRKALQKDPNARPAAPHGQSGPPPRCTGPGVGACGRRGALASEQQKNVPCRGRWLETTARNHMRGRESRFLQHALLTLTPAPPWTRNRPHLDTHDKGERHGTPIPPRGPVLLCPCLPPPDRDLPPLPEQIGASLPTPPLPVLPAMHPQGRSSTTHHPTLLPLF